MVRPEASAEVATDPVDAFGRAVRRRLGLSDGVGLDSRWPDSMWRESVADAFAFVDGRRTDLAVRVVLPGGVALDGGHPQGSLIQLASVDREFIITSVAEALRRRGLRISRMLTVPFGATRGPTGSIAEIGQARGAPHTESFVEVELDDRLDPDVAIAVVNDLRRVMASVFLATDDYADMRKLIGEATARTEANAPALFGQREVGESVALVDWLLDGNCVLLGLGRFPVAGSTGGIGGAGSVEAIDEATSLGLLRDPSSALCGAPDAVSGRLIDVARLPQISVVHRQVPLARFDLTLVDSAGRIDGIGRLVCVFSRKAEASSVQTVPLVRWKLQQVLEEEDAVSGSYDEQAVTSLFQALPKDDLFRDSADELRATIRSLLAEDREHRVRVLMRGDVGVGAVHVLITMPSELYTRTLRRRLERFLLAQLDGERVDVELSMGGSTDTVARFLVHLPDGMEVPTDLDAVARQVQLLCRTWEQELSAELRASVGDNSVRLTAAWADRFPSSYRDAVEPRDAVDDVLILDELHGIEPSDGSAVQVRVVPAVRQRRPAPTDVRLTVAGVGEPVELSRLVPIAESLGLWVVDELHWDVGGIGLHRLTVRRRDDGTIDVDRDGPRVAEAIVALWHGRADVDSLNRLITTVGMTWPEVGVLRAYRRYRRQIDSRYAESYIDDVLVEHGEIARSISELFAARFDPAEVDHERVAALGAQLGAACDRVSRLDHDRILRGLVGTVGATLRTNHGTRPDGPLALKLDPAAVPDLPDPVPYREIFVHGPTVEGVHLRGGPVARGGLRFSDRPEDFRTEVLDLMRTQVLKNALIVPTGAKGGFVVRGAAEPGIDRAATVRSAYEQFVSALLDVTDNIKGTEVVPTPGRWDGDDPYLVVAADKGTAAFSDVANRIAIERDFWLGDAFASGGSVGYDHRALGITARGAWVAVARHLRELGIDVATDPFTVAGVGDMSGDVFGNGMLLSDQIRLVAAFDHRDIFLDPDPDPVATLGERRRLHELTGSSWQDFDAALVSDGAGVFSRSLKRIELSSQVQAALRLTADALTPSELIQAILRAPVDLLYLGGVGTYVRASTESDSSLDDRANAELRVEARQLRARVVGEGANLGFTQRARIEYARRGGHINMDAIDNSAGVDTSDHEVNIKILLGQSVDEGEVAFEDRPEILESVTDDVVAAVLAAVADQSDALSRGVTASAADLDSFESTQAILVGSRVLDADLECLPDTDEYSARRSAGAGLTRPEVAVLLAGAKRQIKAEVLACSLPDVAATRDALVEYFPPPLVSRFGHHLDRHRLRRELVASQIANDLVDHQGPAMVFGLAAEAEVEAAEVVAAYWVARGVTHSPELWAELAAQATSPGGNLSSNELATDSTDAGGEVVDLLEALTRRELFVRRRCLAEGRGHDLGERIEQDRPVFVALRSLLRELDRPAAQRARLRLGERLVSSGVAPPLAAELALLRELTITPDVASLSRSSGHAPQVVAPTFLEVSDRLGFDRLLTVVQETSFETRWQRAARQGLIDDLFGLRREASRRALDSIEPGITASDGAVIARRWLDRREIEVDRARSLVTDLEADRASGLDGLSVAVRVLRRIIT